ncbi:MAG: hypothetical protein QOF14_3875 [Hyphomicrobiales bacterium]|jgi:hypothetical protein|nr:hypothetical protein [Hyphomicrobiales bacterium]
MNRMSTLRLSLSGALLAALACTASAASAQTATTSSSSGVLSTSTTSTATTKKKPTSATADMVNEAIQRSETRAAKEAQSGTPQQWGSEEPFTYNPTVKRFDASQQ